jgi:Arc/MetJ family transcription regulator
MRLRLTLDDELFAKAQRLTGLKETSEVVHAGLRALIASGSAARLAEMGGSDPGARARRRRRPERRGAAVSRG